MKNIKIILTWAITLMMGQAHEVNGSVQQFGCIKNATMGQDQNMLCYAHYKYKIGSYNCYVQFSPSSVINLYAATELSETESSSMSKTFTPIFADAAGNAKGFENEGINGYFTFTPSDFPITSDSGLQTWLNRQGYPTATVNGIPTRTTTVPSKYSKSSATTDWECICSASDCPTP